MLPAPNKNLEHRLSNELPGRQHFTLCQSDNEVTKCILCDSTGQGLLKAYTWFSLDFDHTSFPFADFALYPFTVINHSHEST